MNQIGFLLNSFNAVSIWKKYTKFFINFYIRGTCGLQISKWISVWHSVNRHTNLELISHSIPKADIITRTTVWSNCSDFHLGKLQFPPSLPCWYCLKELILSCKEGAEVEERQVGPSSTNPTRFNSSLRHLCALQEQLCSLGMVSRTFSTGDAARVSSPLSSDKESLI